MPKAERGTPKDIANRCKARGLQKLKYYCQMCEKQCRDENGFQCHLTSDSHLRQMRIFSDNAHGMLDRFSGTFEKSYVETLSRRHGSKRMSANVVYQEVIQDKLHVHMNSTKWTSLSDFVQYLGKTGKCVVEETERGWYVTYISRDPLLLQRQEALQRKKESEQLQEELYKRRIKVQRKKAAEELDRIGGNVHVVPSKLIETTTKVQLSLHKESLENNKFPKNKTKNHKKRRLDGKLSILEDSDSDSDSDEDDGEKIEKEQIKNQVESSIIERISKKQKQQQKQTPTTSSKPPHKTTAKNKNNRKDHWLHTGIYVKVVSKKLGSKFYKRKGIVDNITKDDKYSAQVEIIASHPQADDGGDVIHIDQDDLETVVPTKLGKKCRIVNGDGRGRYAELVGLEEHKYRADLRLLPSKEEEGGRIILKVDYEDFSKAE